MSPFIGFDPMPLHLALIPLHLTVHLAPFLEHLDSSSVETVHFIECAIRQLWSVDHSVDFGPAGPQSPFEGWRFLGLCSLQPCSSGSFLSSTSFCSTQSQIVHVSESKWRPAKLVSTEDIPCVPYHYVLQLCCSVILPLSQQFELG